MVNFYVGTSTADAKIVPVSNLIGKLTHVGLIAEVRIDSGIYARVKRNAVVRFVRDVLTCHSFALFAEGVNIKNLKGSLSRKSQIMERLGHIPDETFIKDPLQIEPRIRKLGHFPVTVHAFDRERTENREPYPEHSFVIVGINLDNEVICVEKEDTREGVRVCTLATSLANCGVLNVFVIDEKSFGGKKETLQS